MAWIRGKSDILSGLSSFTSEKRGGLECGDPLIDQLIDASDSWKLRHGLEITRLLDKMPEIYPETVSCVRDNSVCVTSNVMILAFLGKRTGVLSFCKK